MEELASSLTAKAPPIAYQSNVLEESKKMILFARALTGRLGDESGEEDKAEIPLV